VAADRDLVGLAATGTSRVVSEHQAEAGRLGRDEVAAVERRPRREDAGRARHVLDHQGSGWPP
jgi:hypothetical protein